MLPDLATIEHFHFLRPAFLLLLLPLLAVGFMQRRKKADRDMFGGIIAPHLLEHLRLDRFESRWFNPRIVATIFMLLVMLVLLGPSWRQQPSPLSQDEAALVVLLDVSRSMQQSDVQPSRLIRAKQKIADLLALRTDKKAALIVYAGTAHTVLSLTADRDILNQYLAAINPSIMPRSGKFPEYALPLVSQVLRENTAPATIVLFTDGPGGDSAAAFKTYFSDSPHQFIVVGVGSEQIAEGQVPLEKAALEDLAATAGGHYIELTVDDRDMRRLNRRIDNHFVIVEDSALPWLDSGYGLVFPAMALFLLWFRKGWTLTWCWLLLPMALAGAPAPVLADDSDVADSTLSGSANHWFANLWLTGDQQGRLLMQLGNYADAAVRFSDPMWKAMAYYYDEQFMLAAEYFSRRDSDDALFNEANARAQARDYVRAAHRYQRLLERNPDYPGARTNRDRVQAIIDEINRISESQQQESGISGEDKELGGDDAIPAEGAQEITWQNAEIRQLTADDILQDPATREMWMRGVQQNPSRFLGIKFSMQLMQPTQPAPPTQEQPAKTGAAQ